MLIGGKIVFYIAYTIIETFITYTFLKIDFISKLNHWNILENGFLKL